MSPSSILVHGTPLQATAVGGATKGKKSDYVYVLRSLKDKRYYIGHTNNLERRLQDHNRGKSESVKYI